MIFLYAYENVGQCILNAKTGNGSLQLCHSNFGRNRRLSQLYGVWLMLHGLNSMVAKTYRDHLSECLSSIQSTCQKKEKKARLNTLTQFSNDVSNCQREFGGFLRFPSLNQSLHLVNSHCPPLRSAWSTLQLRLMRCQLHRSRRHLDASMTLVGTSTKHLFSES